MTGPEYVLPDDVAIISHTDRNGVILQVNDDFVTTSGHPRDTLIGQKHSLLRHPDVPEALFRDLWQTIGRGRAWQGVLKNRRADGSYYWARATVTPTTDGGFMSVRVKAGPADIAGAEALFARLRSEKHLHLNGGRLTHTGGPLGRWLGNRSLRFKLLAPLVAGIAVVAAIMAWQTGRLHDAVLHAAGHDSALGLIETARNARLFYNQEVLPDALAHGLTGSHEFRDDPTRIPLHASLMRELSQAPESPQAARIRLYSDHPFSFRNEQDSALDDFERAALAALKQNPQGEYGRLVERDGQPYYRLAVADLMVSQTCVDCHNSYPDSTKRDWKVGDVHGVIEATVGLNEIRERIATPVRLIFAALAVALALLVMLIWAVIDRGNRRLAAASQLAEAIADGDLTHPLPPCGGDEIGRLGNSLAIMRNRLYELASSLRQGMGQLQRAATEMSQSTQVAVIGADQQTSAAAAMAREVEQLSASIKQIEAHAEENLAIAEETGNAAQSGGQAVHAAADEIGRIAQAVNQAAGSLSELEDLSNGIGTIVTSIREIADQTNLLALNAAIEAARAGEAGRGFAVVADEVRKLAERTAASTSEIGGLVQRIQQRTVAAVGEMRQGVNKVEDGVRSAHEAGDAVAGIERAAQRVVDASSEVRRAIQEQSNAAQAIARNVDQVVHSAETHAGTATQSFTASIQVAGLANTLNGLAGQFKLVGADRVEASAQGPAQQGAEPEVDLFNL
ncbi:MAG: methyl-accepting chemotaxis protein [Pseudomonadota bacterium]